MTFPHSPQPSGPRPGPPAGGFRPGPVPGYPAVPQPPRPVAVDGASRPAAGAEDTGHPAVDALLRSLANAAQLPPAEQIAQYEAAHQVLQETLASIDG